MVIQYGICKVADWLLEILICDYYCTVLFLTSLNFFLISLNFDLRLRVRLAFISGGGIGSATRACVVRVASKVCTVRIFYRLPPRPRTVVVSRSLYVDERTLIPMGAITHMDMAYAASRPGCAGTSASNGNPHDTSRHIHGRVARSRGNIYAHLLEPAFRLLRRWRCGRRRYS